MLQSGCCILVNAEFIERPRDTVVSQGYAAYLNCSIRGTPQDIRWNHYAVGARPDQNRLVYLNTQLQPPYDERLRVENSSITSANLIFSSANFDDAGRYECIEDSSRKRTSAQLIVLGKSTTTTTTLPLENNMLVFIFS